jgi:hypothetical protein
VIGLRAGHGSICDSILGGERFLPIPQSVQNESVSHPSSIHFVPKALSAGIKGPWYGGEYSLPAGVGFKNEWNYTSTPNMPSWHAQGQFYLYLYKNRNCVLHEITHKSTNEVFKFIKLTLIQK